jgi:hypothetical protein
LTDACNLPEGFDAAAAFRIREDVEDIKRFLAAFGSMSDNELSMIGERGRSLVEQRFVWSSVSQRMAAVYRWMLGEAGRPDWVVQGGSGCDATCCGLPAAKPSIARPRTDSLGWTHNRICLSYHRHSRVNRAEPAGLEPAGEPDFEQARSALPEVPERAARLLCEQRSVIMVPD